MDPDRPIVRWSLIVLWAAVASMIYEPAIALFGWPLLLIAFVGGILWTLQDFAALRHQTEPIRAGTIAVTIELVVLAACAGAGALVAGSRMFNDAGRDYVLSDAFVPALMGGLLVVSIRAARSPTPRRLAIVSMVALGAMPLLATVQILSVTIVGYGEFRLVSALAFTGYSLATLAIGGIGVHLGIVARQHGYGDDIPAAPPKATLQA
jgi:peptidoglycan/LPS O-acetylase OafA/YrhL